MIYGPFKRNQVIITTPTIVGATKVVWTGWMETGGLVWIVDNGVNCVNGINDRCW